MKQSTRLLTQPENSQPTSQLNWGQTQLQRTKGVGGATASYFLILLGVDGVKVDTLLASWVRTRMGDQTMSGGAIRDLVTRVAAEKFNRDAKELDYAIWRYESVRRASRKIDKKL